MQFNSRTFKVGKLASYYFDDEIKNEPMFFSADLNFALNHGNRITHHFIGALPAEFIDDPTCYMDSRVHMLMPGMYPCIPGWHHDDVPRNTSNGQPNYSNPPYRTKHIMALVNAHVAPTEFLEGIVEVSSPNLEGTVYKQWDDEINSQLRLNKNNHYKVTQVKDRTLYQFDCDSFHRGVEATQRGWRWFGRVSIGRQRTKAAEIRKQVQVYMPTINSGW